MIRSLLLLTLLVPVLASAQELKDPQDSLTDIQVELPSEESIEETAADTPVTHEEIAGDRNLTASRPWKATDFSNQTWALGWAPETFGAPKGLEQNVKFWTDIYTKYTTDQGVVHDSEHIDLVYEELDFTAIMMRTDINIYKKEALKVKQVKDSKARVVEMLKKFEKLEDPSVLDGNEKRIWDYFAKLEDKKKFKEAYDKDRIRFQLGQRDRVIQGIFFSGRYLEEFEKIFKEAGLPLELTRLPFVESSFNVLARSKVGASGLWQIMKYTGRGHLTINKAVDKRNYPMDAARLAAKLLRGNYKMLEAWPLAVTGYNHGPTGVSKLTKLHKSKELGDLFPKGAKKRLGFASRNFFASFVAVLEVERNAPKYFGNVLWSQTLASYEVTTPFEITYKDIMRWFDNDDHKAQIYNPHFTTEARRGKVKIPKGTRVLVPVGKTELVQNELSDQKKFKRIGLEK